jgi:hypothetical protein
MYGRKQVAFLSYCYVKQIFVFVHALEILCKFRNTRHLRPGGIHSVCFLKLLEKNILLSVSAIYPYKLPVLTGIEI